MSDFPLLNTGAVMQYPARKAIQFSTQAVRFVDGTEQRFPGYATLLRRWAIQLGQLTEDEMSRLADFFSVQAGSAGNFSFTDPWDGTVYPNCHFEDDEMTIRLN